MALLVLLFILMAIAVTAVEPEEMAIGNVTRYATGDLFSMIGSDCGPTRCMEVSHGTALSAMGIGSSCMCQCRNTKPAFREDQKVCVNRIEECNMASFGKGNQPHIPFVFLPLKGQIIYPSNEIIFTEVADAICAVTNAQYLSSSGWANLRDVIDNDVPFGLYRDEGNTFLQWRGSSALHSRLEGRLVTVHVECSATSPDAQRTVSCAAFRLAGAAHNTLLDVRSIPFHAGEAVTTEPITQTQGLSVLESLAIGVCVLMLIFVYAAGIVFYIHYKQKQKRKQKDPEMNLSNTISTDNGSMNDPLEARLTIENMCLKTNPLLSKMDIGNDFLHDALSDVSERTEDTIDSSPHNRKKSQKPTVVSAMVHGHSHTHRKKPVRPKLRATSTPERINERLQRRSASPDTFERAPHSELSIVDCSMENVQTSQPSSPEGEPVLRRKLYFNPVFFETEHLKNPPPAAIEFLVKIREVMSVAKDKMTSKRFIPVLSDIPEEESYHTIDLGWDIPCARRGRRFSAISLKRENSRRAIHCGGCPGCDSNKRDQKATVLARSNSCKSCASEDYKQKVVRKWLDEVPAPPKTGKPIKSVAKVSGTPRNVEPKRNEEFRLHSKEAEKSILPTSLKELISRAAQDNSLSKEIYRCHTERSIQRDNVLECITIQAPTKVRQECSPNNRTIRKVKKRIQIPPPPYDPPDPPNIEDKKKPIPEDVKIKMEAVIRELSECKRSESLENLQIENFNPKIIIPITAKDINDDYYFDDNHKDMSLPSDLYVDYDSLERDNMFKNRRFSVAYGSEIKNSTNRKPLQLENNRLTRSWRDVRKSQESQTPAVTYLSHLTPDNENKNKTVREIFVSSFEPAYNNMPKPGPLTIEVRGSPVEIIPAASEDFDPDTLDRKPKKDMKKRVDKMLLKSESFNHKYIENNHYDRRPPENSFNRQIGSLREIYVAKMKVQNDKITYERRGSLPNDTSELPDFLRTLKTDNQIVQTDQSINSKFAMPVKQRRSAEKSPKFSSTQRESPLSEQRRLSEERDRFPTHSRTDILSTRRSSRRSTRTRSRKTDLKKLCKTEDSGYLSTDSNESKCRTRYMFQIRPKSSVTDSGSSPSVVSTASIAFPLHLESDTDDFESLCDGRSESGGESIETDSVFFGNVDESKQTFSELGIINIETRRAKSNQDQVDSGFVCETNTVLSGDSDSEHKSVISIVADHDGRASRASISKTDGP